MIDHAPLKIAIASGKGGTGKTFVATNLFHSLVKKGINVSLADCDAEAPNAMEFFTAPCQWKKEVTHQVPVIDQQVCVFCGKCYEFCAYNAIFYLPALKTIRVSEELCHGCGACSFACEYEAIIEKPVSLGVVTGFSGENQSELTESRMNIGVMSPVPIIKKAISWVKPEAEVVLFDSPPGTSCPFIQTVARADFVVLVTEPTPFGLSDLRQSANTLEQIGKPYGVIINRDGLGDENVQMYLTEKNIPLLLCIPFSRDIATLYSSGKIAAEELKWLDNDLFTVFTKINEQYGNSHHQR